MALKFGTDGVRGVANAELTPEFILALGRAAARVLGGYTFLVGRDTRASGSLVQAALSAGLASEGVDVVDLGVIPTPGVAALSAERRLGAAVISASHNPFADNGVKLFAPGGKKLPDEVERRLEEELAADRAAPAGGAKTGAAVGRLRRDDDAIEWYRHRLERSIDGRDLSGLKVVLDCAHGAAVATAPGVFRSVGAHVLTTADSPDGININAGVGATVPEAVAAKVVEAEADFGLAFDGDADRVIAVDAQGEVVDGDQIMAIAAIDLHARGLLRDDTVVVTVMTNLG
ncbi:MAG: phosphoglucosamine mutase, partial [Acidimicrobiia bacterium]